MPKLFSYVVDHDYGFAPNPFGGFYTLAKCKYATTKRNIVELAEVGDGIAGTGGADLCKSAGHGKLIYAMRVDEVVPLNEYCHAHGGDCIDAEPEDDGDDRLTTGFRPSGLNSWRGTWRASTTALPRAGSSAPTAGAANRG